MLTCIGLMSGTSLDGVDVALLKTDGVVIESFGPTATYSYGVDTKQAIMQALGDQGPVDMAETSLTWAHVSAVFDFLSKNNINADEIDLLGFHGQTILHRPEEGITRQIGNGQLLANETSIDVISDFRTKDVENGGEGAPFAPVLHQALSQSLEQPLAVLNVGGVSNVTWIGNGDILACDTGPGNALLDDWCRKHFDQEFDEDGRLARSGVCHEGIVEQLVAHPFFNRPAPKSLDRDDFAAWSSERVKDLSPEDGAATLLAFTVESIARAQAILPEPVQRWLVCGGGRKNSYLMETLQNRLGTEVSPVEAVGWDGDGLEAQAFAYMAARSLKELPLSFPSTTGVNKPMTGGRLYKPL
ncbi:MAG: anhydro-N-acetylmuramic acid kinase [Rhodospirillales bacterium]|nr:anhydro-N-acetylmuramic acid kinase [Rhodospirillales bacterium]